MRIDDLLDQLTSAEKVAMLHQCSPAVERLGLAAFRTGTEALHGAAWLGESTVFPQAVGLGATWNPALLRRIGEITGIEVRALHAIDPTVSLNVWAPVVNLLRDPRWGRNEEGYSEDPLMTSLLAIAYCRGLRGPDPDHLLTAPTLKHFLAYNNEDGRSVTSSSLRPRVRHEYDLPPFRGPVEAGVVDGVMPAYNLVNGRPAHLSPDINELLRTWSPHELLIVSDAEAPSNLAEAGSQHYLPDHETGHAAALLAGIDSFTDHGADPSVTSGRITRALERGLISEKDVERAVHRLLTIRARVGEFDPAADPYASIGSGALNRPEHADLAREAGREQVVLLKNDPLPDGGPVLPLAAAPGLRVAVVGPFAGALCQDWYSGTMPYRVCVADGLKDRLEAAGGTVVRSDAADRITLRLRGTDRFISLPDDPQESPVLRVGGLDGANGLGGAGGSAEAFDVFDWGAGVVTLRSERTGLYVQVRDEGRTLVADQVQPHGWETHETFTLLRQDDGAVVVLNLFARAYLRIDDTGALVADADEADDAQRFVLDVVGNGLDQVRAAVADADVAVVVVGNDPHINGRETQDRTTLDLPPAQDALVRAVAGWHPRTVLLVMSSYPYALTWADDNVPAIAWTSHAGQETGNAVADVLFGDHSPSARLPQTWYRSDDDLPDILEYDVIKARRTYQYFEGRALYPFGHGLTYTTFGYGPAEVMMDGDTVRIRLDVTNLGSRGAVEVVQVYTRATGAAPDRPVRRLQGWARIELEPGHSEPVQVEFPLSQLAHWDVATHGWRVEPGAYEVLVGRSSEAIESRARLVVPGEPAGPRQVLGIDVAAADFDDYENITLVDTSRERGDAVEPVGASPSHLLFRDVGLGLNGGRLTARVSRTASGDPAVLEVRIDSPDGPLLASADVPDTGGRYVWTEVTAPVTGEADRRGEGARDVVHDLYLVFRGSFRLDTFRLDPSRLAS